MISTTLTYGVYQILYFFQQRFWSCIFSAYESLDEGEQRLLKYLKNFSVNSRPVNISSKAVHVNATMQIVRLDAVVRKCTFLEQNTQFENISF